MKYTLASAKLVEGSGGWIPFNKSQDIEHLYIRSKCLQTQLESVCAFSLMEPTKVVARLGKNLGDTQS